MAKNSPDEGKNIKMVEKQAVEASMINLKEYPPSVPVFYRIAFLPGTL